jgi:hypothetical protein
MLPVGVCAILSCGCIAAKIAAATSIAATMVAYFIGSIDTLRFFINYTHLQLLFWRYDSA